jgi:hypothetical protein
MTPPTVDRWCCRTVELAARMLPAEHRQRYALEFIAELYGMSHPQQVSHSVQVLSRAWALRAALDAAALGPIPEKARHRTRGWLLCHLGRHLWALHRNPDVGGKDAVFELCRRCGRERQGYEAPPPGSVLGG